MNYETYYQAAPSRARDFRKTARQALKGFWWTAILVTLIASLLGGVTINNGVNFNSGFGGTVDSDYADPDYGTEEDVEDSLFTDEELAEIEQALDEFDFTTLGGLISDAYPVLGFVLSFIVVLIVVVLFVSILFQLFVASPVKVGYQRFFLEVIDYNEDEIRVGTLFRFFKQSYFKTIGLNIVHTLLMQLTLLPMWIGMIVGGISLSSSLPNFFINPSVADFGGVIVFFVAIMIGTIVSLVISIPVTYMYSMAHLIMADYPTVGAIEAMRLSRQMMQGNKWRLFCLDFSFIGWYFLGACACGLGTFAVVPFHYTARAAFYEEISGRKTPEDVEFPSINPEDYIVE
ncbi:MAG: DUF975 family protein [Clostridia bacterium]|nr:DUF975 family protein [Clostridia bacterium]